MMKFYKKQLSIFLFAIVMSIGITSCRKEINTLTVENNFSRRQLIKEGDLLKVINENPAFKMLTLDWSKAKQAQIGGKSIVRVPTINADKLKNLLPNNELLQHKTKTGNSESPNFNKNHPPEVFFIKEKDNVNPFLLNFVPTNIGIDTGKNGIWTGKLYEWNLIGNLIHIQDIDNSKLKRNYLLQIGDDVAKTKNSKGITTQSWFSDFFDWIGGVFSDVWDAINWLGYNLGIPGAYTYDDWGYKEYRTWEFGGGGGDGDGGGNGGGGYYYGAGDPAYNGYLPGYNPYGDFDSPTNDPYQPYPHGGPRNTVLPYLDPYVLDDIQRQQAIDITKNVVRSIEEYFWTEEPLSDYQLEVLSELCLEEFAAEYYNNSGQFGEILAMQPEDDDNPFWEFLKKKLRQFLGYEQPETPEEREQLERIGSNAKATAIGLRNINEGFRLFPGMSLLQAMRENEGYTAATIDLSADLFGGTLLKMLGSPLLKLSNKYLFKVNELATKYPNIAAKLKSFNISEFNIIKRSNTEKVIIIGEDMGKRILPAQETFRKIFKNAETFRPSPEAEMEFAEKVREIIRLHGRDRLTDAEMRLTRVYRENVDWMIEKLNNGYNVIDIGPKMPSIIKSPSYAMERSFIYKK